MDSPRLDVVGDEQMRLGVNIDHVATIRQARRAREPEPVVAAGLAELGGADGITVHLRGDRRHIQDRDLRLLREVVSTRLNVEAPRSRRSNRSRRPRPGGPSLVSARSSHWPTGSPMIPGHRWPTAPLPPASSVVTR